MDILFSSSFCCCLLLFYSHMDSQLEQFIMWRKSIIIFVSKFLEFFFLLPFSSLHNLAPLLLSFNGSFCCFVFGSTSKIYWVIQFFNCVYYILLLFHHTFIPVCSLPHPVLVLLLFCIIMIMLLFSVWMLRKFHHQYLYSVLLLM